MVFIASKMHHDEIMTRVKKTLQDRCGRSGTHDSRALNLTVLKSSTSNNDCRACSKSFWHEHMIKVLAHSSKPCHWLAELFLSATSMPRVRDRRFVCACWCATFYHAVRFWQLCISLVTQARMESAPGHVRWRDGPLPPSLASPPPPRTGW